jgi:hypothetical protein
MATIPSLALIPSGYKASKVYSVLPTDGTGDFDFTRSGNATRVNSDGLIELVSTNVPRLNYPLIDGVVSGCPSLLLEPQRINVFQRSEEFSNAYWSTSRIETPYIADVVSPDGTLNAFTLEMSSGETNGGGIFKSGISISGDNSFSVFAKKKTANYLVLADTGTINNAVYFDLENGVVRTTYNATGEMEYFGNGWYRCTMKYSLTSAFAKFIYLSNIDAITSGAVVGGDSVYIWGVQLEAGTHSTSYIPTTTTIGTRSAETCNNAGDVNTFNDSEGVLMAEISALDNPTSQEVALSVSEGQSGANRLLIRMKTNGEIGIVLRVANTNEAIIDSGTLNQLSNHKVAVKWKVNDIALWIDGVEVGTDNSANVFTANTLNEISFNQGNNSNFFYGNAKQIQYFDSALNDSDLETLTSWVSFSDMAIGQLYTIE